METRKRGVMAVDLTPKQEAFCQAYIETGNASEAYRQSYNAGKMKPESVNRKAKELLDNVKITARVAVIQEEHRERHNVTVDSITKELEEARTKAIESGQNSAAVQATMGKAKIHGLIVDKREDVRKPSRAERIARLSELVDRFGA
jgi:phage terminase small subunit